MRISRYILVLIAIVSFYRCDNSNRIIEKYKTTGEFKRIFVQNKLGYSTDSLSIEKLFRQMIISKVSPYSDDVFNNKTKIFIDSIIYSPDGKYISIFIIMQCFNGSMKHIYEMDPNSWHFDGIVHFAEKVNDSVDNKYYWKIFNYHGTKHINGETYDKISKIVRAENLAGRRYAACKNNYEGYNVDDYRFWSSKMFKRIQIEGYIKIYDSIKPSAVRSDAQNKFCK